MFWDIWSLRTSDSHSLSLFKKIDKRNSFFKKCICFWLLRCCVWLSLGTENRGCSRVAVHRLLLIAVAFLVAVHRFVACSMWNLSRSMIKPVSPALAGRFLTTGPPGKPSHSLEGDIKAKNVRSSLLTKQLEILKISNWFSPNSFKIVLLCLLDRR